jgi:hypothetical protein
MYEAPFCCNMRYSEGLLEYTQNQELFAWNEDAEMETDVYGRKFIDDKLLVMQEDKVVPLFLGHALGKDSKIALKVLF